MQLGDYLKKHQLTPQDFAPKIGVKVLAVYRYISGARIPTKPIMHRIFKVTGGQVTPNDIFGIHPNESGHEI